MAIASKDANEQECTWEGEVNIWKAIVWKLTSCFFACRYGILFITDVISFLQKLILRFVQKEATNEAI